MKAEEHLRQMRKLYSFATSYGMTSFDPWEEWQKFYEEQQKKQLPAPSEKTWPTGLPVPEPAAPKCECGGSKANTTHADWCPIYRKFK
jgi:hypothetical protein